MERKDILREISSSTVPVIKACKAFRVSRSSYYRWRAGAGVGPPRRRGHAWNALSDEHRKAILELSDEYPGWNSRQLAWYLTDHGAFAVSESTVYRLLKARGKLPDRPCVAQRAAKQYAYQPSEVHELWQTDFTDFSLPAWGLYHCGTVIDDRSRFLLHHDLRAYEKAKDAMEVFSGAVEFAMRTHGYVARRILSDNGSCFIADETRSFLEGHGIRPINARSHHPQTVGKMERLNRTMKETVNLVTYDYPWELAAAVAEFYRFYNYERYHEALGNLTPADVYFGRGEERLRRRREQRKMTTEERRRRYEAWKKSLTGNPTNGRIVSGPEHESTVCFQEASSVPKV